MPTMFKKMDFVWWVCEEHPNFEAVIDFVNSQIVLLKNRREISRFSSWEEVEEYVSADLKKPQV